MWIQIKRVSSAHLCESEESIPKFHTNEILLNAPYPSQFVQNLYIYNKSYSSLHFALKKKKTNSMNMGPLQIQST